MDRLYARKQILLLNKGGDTSAVFLKSFVILFLHRMIEPYSWTVRQLRVVLREDTLGISSDVLRHPTRHVMR
jgi:hypothetical protein